MIDIFKNFAGGNIRVRSVNGKNVSIEQEIRDTSEWWFYWCFGAETDEDGEYVFQFVNGDVIGPWGVALSFDRENWFYDKNLTFISRNSFKYPFQKGKKVYFSFSLPYTEKDFEKFLSGGVSIKKCFFCKTERGRDLFLYEAGNRRSENVFLITARHHACESAASYALEGLISRLTEKDNAIGRDFALDIVPFVDLDGVEDGDQGKSRAPHDHNRDYLPQPLYNVTKALYARYGNRGIRFGADLHSPAKYGGIHDRMSLIEGDERISGAQRRFSDILERETAGAAIEYKRKDNIIFGTHWNKGCRPDSLSFFIAHGAELAFTFEHPYFGNRDAPYMPGELRDFGRRMADAFVRYYEEE